MHLIPLAVFFLVTTQDSVAARLPSLMDSAGIPGMSIAVLDRGEITWMKGFGVRSVSDTTPIDENTVFEAASLSKPVVAYVTLKLVDAGLLNVDRPLQEYIGLPELPDRRASRITTRMVLSHTTGLQNERMNGESLALAFDPGHRFSYSGEAFLLLQRALESITGQSLDDLSRRLVFNPLGMTRTAFTWRNDFADNAAVGHGDFKTVRRPTRPTAGRAPSSLHTTARDYALLVRAIMRREGLESGTFDEMLKPQVRVAPQVAWGLGWSLDTSDSLRAFWHWGDNSNSGFTAFVLIDPAKQKAVLYFANSSTGLGIVRRVLALTGGSYSAPAFMNYEAHDAASRRVRLAVEQAVRTRGAGAGLSVYDSLKSRLGSTAFPETLLNNLGYRFLSMKRPHDAIALFQRNVREFPRSSNAFDSLGDGFVAIGNKDAAIASYLKSYELDRRNERALGEAQRLRANR